MPEFGSTQSVRPRTVSRFPMLKNLSGYKCHQFTLSQYATTTAQVCDDATVPSLQRPGVELNPLLHLLPSTLGKALRKHISARERAQGGFKSSVGSQINTVMKDLRVMGSGAQLRASQSQTTRL